MPVQPRLNTNDNPNTHPRPTQKICKQFTSIHSAFCARLIRRQFWTMSVGHWPSNPLALSVCDPICRLKIKICGHRNDIAVVSGARGVDSGAIMSLLIAGIHQNENDRCDN